MTEYEEITNNECPDHGWADQLGLLGATKVWWQWWRRNLANNSLLVNSNKRKLILMTFMCSQEALNACYDGNQFSSPHVKLSVFPTVKSSTGNSGSRVTLESNFGKLVCWEKSE